MAYTATVDARGYTGGTKLAGEVLVENVMKDSFLIPGKTFTLHVLADQREVELPVITKTDSGSAVDLCDAMNPGSYSTRWENISINKKAGERFDGCFTITGTAQKDIERALNNTKTQNMQNQYEEGVFTYIEENVTSSDKLLADYGGDYFAYLNALKTEYRRKTMKRATVAFVSLEFFEKLTNARANLGTALGDEVQVAGAESTRYNGLTLYPVDYITTDIILFNPAGLNIAFASNTKAIGRGVLGAVDSGQVKFYGGLTSHHSGGAGGAYDFDTWVGLPFGVKITNPEWFLSANAEVVAP